MRVWHGKVSSNIGADPVGDVRLVHWVHIHFVFAWAWHVKVLCARTGLHAEAELGVLARPVIGSSWVSEIEVASDFVVARPWYSQVLSRLLADLSVFPDVLVLDDSAHAVSSRVAKGPELVWIAGVLRCLARMVLSLEGLTWVCRRVFLWTNWMLFEVLLLAELRSLWIDDDETRYRILVCWIIFPWAWHTAVLIS